MRIIISLIIIVSFFINGQALLAGPQAEILSISALNWDGTPALNGIQFTAGDATIDAPWVHSPQYVRVIYSSDEAIWGVRLVTNNEGAFGQVYPKPINKGLDNQWEWEKTGLTAYQYVNGIWQTGDDSVSFAGLIDNATKGNPSFRAKLAWQVYANPVPSPSPIFKNWQGVWNVGGNWNDDWAYVIDRSDKWNGQSSVDGVFEPNTWNAKYDMVAVGTPLTNNLTQHPVVSGSKANPDPKYGDGDIAIYFAGCFGLMQDNAYIGLLPAGSYTTALYVQLIHE
jgi:hypothetical protein